MYHISEIAKENIGNKGLVARWGGDEFIGIIYETPDIAHKIMNSMVYEISEMQDCAISHITINLGATYISAESCLGTLIKECDMALYQAKENGRNQIAYH